MTPFEYAKLCADRYPRIDIKGRGHAPRVRVNRVRNPFLKLLPLQKIVDERHSAEDFSYGWYAAQCNYNAFLDDLMAAGIDALSGEIVSASHWATAQAVLRLTGELFDHLAVLKLSDEVRAGIEAAADRELNAALRDSQL